VKRVHRTHRIKAALASAAAALLVLLAMSLNIGGVDNFVSIITGCGALFLGVAFTAAGIGCFLASQRMRWSLIAGALAGLLGGWIIVLWIVSHI
jgi:hypothetical protein